MSGGVVSFTGPGTCTIDANQGGNGSYTAATQVQQSFNVGKGSQTLSFTSSVPASPKVGGTYSPTATSSVGLTPTITVDSASAAICSISGGVVSFNAVGNCVLDANQAGNANYLAATQIQQTVLVGKATPGVGLSASSSSPLFGVSVTFTATLSGGVTPTGTVTFKDGATTLATVPLSGLTASFSLTSLTIGTHSITAIYSGDARNATITSAPASVAVGARPNPGANSTVQGLLNAQVGFAMRFGQVQIDNTLGRLEQMHDEDDAAGGVGPAGGNGGGGGNAGNGGGAGSGRQASTGSSGSPAGTGPYGDLRTASTGVFSNRSVTQAMASVDEIPGLGTKRTQNDGGRALQMMASTVPGAIEAINRNGNLPFHIWAAGTVGFGSLQSDTASNNRFSTSGLTIGIDRKFTETLKAGVALGMAFDQSRIGNDGSASSARSYSGALYTSWQFMPHTYLDVTGGVGSLRFDINRYDTNGPVMLMGQRRGSELFGSIGLAHDERYGAWKVSPYLRLNVIRAMLDAYTETGSAIWALSYDKMTTTTSSGVIGTRFAYTIPTNWGTLTPMARFEYRHAFDSGYTQTLNYADLVGVAAGYSVAGTAVTRNAYTAGLMLRAETRDRLTVDLEYQLTASAKGLDGQRVRASGRYAF